MNDYTGQEFDYEGLNLGGIGKAGAEAGIAFVGSFVEGINPAGLAAKLPGMLTGVVGDALSGSSTSLLSGLLLGKGASVALKGVGTLKSAFAGLAGTVGSASAATGGLSAALSAVPVAGWAVGGVLAAVVGGIALYNSAVARREEELKSMGSKVTAAADEYREAAQKIRETRDLIAQRETLQIAVELAEKGVTEKDVVDMLDRLDAIKIKKKEIEVAMTDGSLTPEQMVEYSQSLQNATIEEIAIKATLNPIVQDEITDVEAQIEALKTREAELSSSLDPIAQGELAAVRTQIKKLEEEKAQLQAKLLPIDQGEVTALREALAEEKISLEAQLNANDVSVDKEAVRERIGMIELQETVLAIAAGEDPDLSTVTDKLAAIEERGLAIKGKLEENPNLSQTEIDAYQAELDALESFKLTITGYLAGLDEDSIAALKAQTDALGAELIAASNGFLSLYDQEGGYLDQKIEKMKTILDLQMEMNRAARDEAIREGEAELPAIAEKRQEKQEKADRAQEYVDNNRGEMDVVVEAQKQLVPLVEEFKALNADRSEEGYAALQAWLEENKSGMDGILDLLLENNILNFDESERDNKRGDPEDILAQLDGVYGDRLHEYQEALKELTGLRGDIEELDLSALSIYAEKVNALADDAFKGTKYEGMTLNELEQEYGGMSFADRSIYHDLATEIGNLRNDPNYANSLDDEMLLTALQLIARAEERAKESAVEPEEGQEQTPTNVQLAIEEIMRRNVVDEKGDTLFTQQLRENEAAYQEAGSEEEREQVLKERQEIIEGQYKAIEEAITASEYLDEQIAATGAKIDELTERAAALEEAYALVSGWEEKYGAMSEEEKQSFEGTEEAQKALAEINEALNNAGLENVSSWTDLAGAMESINAASKDNADGIASYAQALAELDADQVTLLTSIHDALNTVGWNAKEIAAMDLPEALRIEQGTLDRFSTLETRVGNVNDKVKTLKSELNQLKGTYEVEVLIKEKRVFEGTSNLPSNVTVPTISARGRITEGPLLSWIGEDGPEAVIPLGPKYRSEGLSLLSEAGARMGVPMGPSEAARVSLPPQAAPAGGQDAPKIEVQVQASPQIIIEGGEAEDIVEALKARLSEIAELLGSEMADKIIKIFDNMPLRSAG